MQKPKLYPAILCLAFLLLFSCSREKDTMISRAYHNTTSRYNGYFNARELMKEKESNLRSQYVDDYTQILPIFIYPNENKSQSMTPDMEKVIEKCSEVIDRHSMYIQREEKVKWIDDSYILIGKARFYKLEYTLAEETFLYVYQAFKRKEQRYEGLTWLIKTFIETRQWDKAEEFIDLAEDEKNKIEDEFLGAYYATVADFWIKRDKDYEKGMANLEEAIRYEEDKEKRRRYTYILAQIHQMKRDFAPATRLYGEVIKMNPDYVMRFNAKINRAVSYDVSTLGSEDIRKELRKMLKDKKNEEFRDQIYYALAELALKEDNEPQAVDYLRKSTKFSVNNDRQKGLSYLKLADLFFERPEYVKAQAHYDSTLQYLPDDHPEYYEAESKNDNLQDLVTNLKIISRLDSLLALGQMSEKDRKKKVKEMVEEMKRQDEQKKEAELIALRREQEQANSQGLLGIGSSGGRNKGKWYFYNATTMAMGNTEFKRIWGNRPLEDNWRRKGKSQNSNQQTNDQSPNANSEDLAQQNEVSDEEKYNVDNYLEGIPVDIKDQLNAHGEIVAALFNVGTIFKESFNDNPSAIKSFERIVNEYDTSQYNLPAHYQLYRIYLGEGNEELKNKEKEWILDNHPFSEYAYLIKNPNYSKESKASKQKIEEYYEATYRLYEYGLYQDVVESCEKAEQVFKENHIEAKYDFLKAKAIGHLKSKEEFKKALLSVIKEHPKDSVKQRAEYILNYMNQMGKEGPKTSQKEIFEYLPNENYFFIMSLSVNNSNARPLKLALANFNQTAFKNKKLDFTTSALPQRTLYLIRTFDDEMDAMQYLSALKANQKLMSEVRKSNADPYIISLTNFRAMFKDKNEQEYLEYFGRKYGK